MRNKLAPSLPTEDKELDRRPEIWVLRLIDARERGDHRLIAEALDQLKGLGVHVVFGRPAKPSVLPGGAR